MRDIRVIAEIEVAARTSRVMNAALLGRSLPSGRQAEQCTLDLQHAKDLRR